MNGPYFAVTLKERGQSAFVVYDSRRSIAQLVCPSFAAAEALADQLNQWVEERS